MPHPICWDGIGFMMSGAGFSVRSSFKGLEVEVRGFKGGLIYALSHVLWQWVMASQLKPDLGCSLPLSLLEDYKACPTPDI